MPRSQAATSRQTQSSMSADDNRLADLLLTMTALYQTHIHPLLPEPLKPVSTYASNLLLSASPFLTQFLGIFKSVLSSASSLATGNSQDNSSALLSLGVLLITLYTGLKIMNYIRRSIMGWVWLGVKMVLVLLMVQVGWYVNSYGWERAAKNAGWIGGIAWGMLEDFIENQNGNGQQKQPRGTRKRGQNGYTSGQRGAAAGGRGWYG